MVSSMDSVVSEDHFTRRHYNDIVFMLSYMDSEGDIQPVSLSAKNNHDEDYPKLIESIAVEESDPLLQAMNTEIIALEKREAWVKYNKSQLTTNTNIMTCTWSIKRKSAPYGFLRKYKAILCVQGDIQKQIST